MTNPAIFVHRRHVRTWLYVAVISCLCLEAGCKPAEGPPSRLPKNEDMEVHGEVVVVRRSSWPTIARVQGSVFADEVSTIAAKVAGRIVEVNCDLGDVVHAGQQLIKLDDREYILRVVQTEAQLAQARAAIGLKTGDPVSSLDPLKSPPVRETQAVLEEAQRQVNRLETLYEQGAVVATDLDAAQSAERVADARFNSALNSVREKIALVGVQEAELALAKQQLEDTVVVAPFDGMIQNRMVAVGTYLQVGEPIVELARTSVLRYRASVPERFAQQLRIGQSLYIHLDRQEREATVTRISPTLDPLSRSLTFEATVPNSDNSLRSGLFASAEIVIDETATALVVPTSALLRFAGVEKVWRVTDGRVVEAVVQVGREVDGMLAIETGLSEGDEILLFGQTGRVGKYVPNDEGGPAADSAATDPAATVGLLPSTAQEEPPLSASKPAP